MHHFVSLLLFLATAESITIPSWTGPYNVGVTQHVFNHTTPNDPTAPNNTGINYLATFYYPTNQTPHETRRYIDPELAEIYEAVYSYPKGSLGTITTKLQFQAQTLPVDSSTRQLPTLVFGPGGAGPPSSCYTALLSDLASYGYFVAALDHPYEQPFIQLPYGGKGIYGLPANISAPLSFYSEIYDFRITDTLDFLHVLPSLVESFGNPPFNTTHYVLFGHSLGGAAAIGTMQEVDIPGTTVLGAINLDGTLFGAPNSTDPSEADTKKPVFLFGNEGHTYVGDPSWLTFPLAQTGWWREANVLGAAHLDFSDVTFWKAANQSGTPEVDVIKAGRMIEIVRSYVKGFVGFVSGGDMGLLAWNSIEFPEVVFVGGSA